MDNSPKRAEMNKELKNARTALLAVGIIMFVMDMIFIHGVYRDRLLPEDRNVITAISAALLCGFIALWYFTPKHPRLCLGLGFAAFWGIQIYNMVQDPSTIGQGIILKVLFTVALVKGFKSANRAEELRRELVDVFE